MQQFAKTLRDAIDSHIHFEKWKQYLSSLQTFMVASGWYNFGPTFRGSGIDARDRWVTIDAVYSLTQFEKWKQYFS